MDVMTGIAFPGQGGRWAAVQQQLTGHRDHELVNALVDRLGREPEQLDPDDTRHVQPAVYVAGLVSAPSGADIAVGHSLGEITAAAWAGAIDPPAGIELLIERARLGHAVHVDRPGAMVAVNRWSRHRVEQLRREAQFVSGAVLDLAVVNSPTQMVLSGEVAAVDTAVALANDRGAVARRLPIGGAYHSTLLCGVLDRFEEFVRRIVTNPPRVPLVSSTTTEMVEDTDRLVETLTNALVDPVDWPATMTVLRTHGVDRIIDAGPGDTLIRLGRHLDGPATVQR